MIVRFRLWGEPSSTLEGGVAGEFVPVVDRWLLSKGVAWPWSREVDIWSRCFAFVRSTVVGSLGGTPIPSSERALLGWRDAVDNSSASGMLAGEDSELRGGLNVWALSFIGRTDGRFGALEVGSDSVADNAASRSRRASGSSATRLGRIRPFGAGTSREGWSVFFAPIAAASAGCDSGSNATGGGLVSSDRTFGLEVAASLGRRRTSTVNDGTVRLNVVLDTPGGSADSSRPRRPCEAKHSKAIGNY